MTYKDIYFFYKRSEFLLAEKQNAANAETERQRGALAAQQKGR